MGHGAQVSLKHYAQTTDDHFERAAEGGAQASAKGGAQPTQNRAQRAAVVNVRVSRNTPEGFDDLGVAQEDAKREGTKLLQSIEVLGFEASSHALHSQ